MFNYLFISVLLLSIKLTRITDIPCKILILSGLLGYSSWSVDLQ